MLWTGGQASRIGRDKSCYSSSPDKVGMDGTSKKTVMKIIVFFYVVAGRIGFRPGSIFF
jgi:hypothetical protein